MLEKAELTLIKMLSKTKKVITTPPPVLCSMASYKLFYTIEWMLEHFHCYLCRQLKDGGMEIKMKMFLKTAFIIKLAYVKAKIEQGITSGYGKLYA